MACDKGNVAGSYGFRFEVDDTSLDLKIVNNGVSSTLSYPVKNDTWYDVILTRLTSGFNLWVRPTNFDSTRSDHSFKLHTTGGVINSWSHTLVGELIIGQASANIRHISSLEKFEGKVRNVEVYRGSLEDPSQFSFNDTGEDYRTIMLLRSNRFERGNAKANSNNGSNFPTYTLQDGQYPNPPGFLWTSGTQVNNPNTWLKIEFPEERLVTGIGISQYWVYRRLKELKLTFSDASTQTISASNKESSSTGVNVYPNIENIPLNGVYTNSILIEPISIYPEDSSSTYMGFYRLHVYPDGRNSLFGDTNVTKFKHKVTTVGDPSNEIFNDTEFLKNGLSSFALSGGYLKVDDHEDFDFASEDFTIDFFVSIADIEQIRGTIFSKQDFDWLIYLYNHDGDKKMSLFAGDGSSPSWYIGGTNGIKGTKDDWQENRFYHIAITREDFVYRVFVDGKIDIEFTDTSKTPLTSPNVPIQIGAHDENPIDRRFYGHLDDFRIVKGKALYTQDFDVDFSMLDIVNKNNNEDIMKYPSTTSPASLILTTSGDFNSDFAIASNEDTISEQAWHAFDSNVDGTRWETDTGNTITHPNWIVYGFDSPRRITSYSVRWPASAPANIGLHWELQGTNDSILSYADAKDDQKWITLDIVTEKYGSLSFPYHPLYTFDNEQTFRYYRFYNVKSATGSVVSFSDIILREDTSGVTPNRVINSVSGLMIDNKEGHLFSGRGSLSGSSFFNTTPNPQSEEIPSTSFGSSNSHTEPTVIKRHLQDTKLVTKVIDLGYKSINRLDISESVDIVGGKETPPEKGTLLTHLSNVGQFETNTVEISGISKILKQGDFIETSHTITTTLTEIPSGSIVKYRGVTDQPSTWSNIGVFMHLSDTVPALVEGDTQTRITQIQWSSNPGNDGLDSDVYFQLWGQTGSTTVFTLKQKHLLRKKNTYSKETKYVFDVDIVADVGDLFAIGYSEPLRTGISSRFSSAGRYLNTSVLDISSQQTFNTTSTWGPRVVAKFEKVVSGKFDAITDIVKVNTSNYGLSTETLLSNVVMGSNYAIPNIGDGSGYVTRIGFRLATNTTDVYAVRWAKVNPNNQKDTRLIFKERIKIYDSETYFVNVKTYKDINMYVEAGDLIGLQFSDDATMAYEKYRTHANSYYLKGVDYNYGGVTDKETTFIMDLYDNFDPIIDYSFTPNNIINGVVNKDIEITKTFVVKENTNNNNSNVVIIGGIDDLKTFDVPVGSDITISNRNIGDLHGNDSVKMAWIRSRSDVAESLSNTSVSDTDLNAFRDGINNSIIEDARKTSIARGETAFVQNNFDNYQSGDKGTFFGNVPTNQFLEEGIEAEEIVMEHEFKVKKQK
jgi:hypothetical protein